MRKKSKLGKKLTALLLAASMSLSLSSATVLAETEDAVAAYAEEAIPGTDADMPETPAEDFSSEIGNASETPEDAEEVISDPVSEDEEEAEISVEDETLEEDAAEAEEDGEFEECGEFGLSVTDANGSKVKCWYDNSANIYYLFLTNAVSIPEMELQVEGIPMKAVSKGTLDPKRNVVTGAFSASGDGITLTAKNGKKYNVVVKQSGLPSLSITLNGVDLQTINSGSKTIKYAGNSVILTDASGNINLSQSDVEVKGRGNTTWDCSEKKPYQIKFDKKQSVLGMAKAKKWVLLANSFDDDMLRNKAAYYLGDQMNMAFSPDFQNCDLWVDGEYRGTYAIGEKVEINSSRLNLSDPLGSLCELDCVFYNQEEYWFKDTNTNLTYTLKESVDEDNALGALNHFRSSLDAFEKYLFNTNPSSITLANLGKYISVDDFAKWILVNEYLSNCESTVTSWYWYKDGPNDVIHLGPLWDFDISQGMAKQFSEANRMYFIDNQRMCNRLMQIPAFAKKMEEIFRQYRGVFSGLSSKVQAWGSELASAADGNYTRWKFLGQPNQKGNARAFKNTYAEAVNAHAAWLSARDTGFRINVPAVPTAKTEVSLSSNQRMLTVKATEIKNTSSIRVAVWSKTNSQDDLVWYPLVKNADGSMSVQVNLAKHGGSDVYYAHVYSGNTCLGTHTLNVEMVSLEPEISASFNEADRTINITVKNAGDYTSLDTAVWSEVNSQDDLKWYSKPVPADGTVTYSVKASDHKGTGNYLIHVYGRQNGKQLFAGKTTVKVTAVPKPEVIAVQEEGGSDLKITAKYVAGYSAVRAAVWGAVDGQNDLKWYPMVKQADGTYTLTVDSASHKELGNYYIHLYGTKNSTTNNFIGNTTLNVVAPAGPVLSVTTVSEGSKYQAVLKNASSCESMRFAVWGAVDGQNDIIWYNANRSGSNWVVDIDLQNHREAGLYYVHAYGMKSDKQIFQDATSFTAENVEFARIDITLSNSGKLAIANLENCDSFTSVQMAVWSQKNSQDDLKWLKASKNLDGSWTCDIDVYSHKDTGLYYVHAYGMKNGKQVFSAGTTFTVNAFKGMAVSTEDKGTSFLAKAVNADDYSSVRIAVWTQYKDQDDLKWYQAAKYSDGSFRYFVNCAKHGGNGTYNVHFYGTKDGKETLIGKAIFIEDSFEKAELQAVLSEDGTTMTVTATDPVGYTKIQVAVWGSVDGQNDLKWYTMTKNSDGNYTATVKIADHKEKGIYNLHAYGWCGSVQLFMANTNCEVA